MQHADTATRVDVSGFVDMYYAYDFNRPADLDRVYTTQAARHNEFNVNLAYLDATLNATRVRGRLAVQFGTSVQANYAAEPRVGSLSGPDVSRFIQEAYAGYQLTPRAWLDAGVFLAPFGAESWVSSDNWTYTRSLIADNSPYYESGARLTWKATPQLTTQLHVINGWQNVSETNSDKAVAVRVDYTGPHGVAFFYDAFAGNEQPDTAAAELRLFQEISSRIMFGHVGLAATLDYGTQPVRGEGRADWNGWSILSRWAIADRFAFGARLERYADPHQVIVATGKPFGFQSNGESLNVDIAADQRLLLRFEARALQSPHALFPRRTSPGGTSTRDLVAVSSVALLLK